MCNLIFHDDAFLQYRCSIRGTRCGGPSRNSNRHVGKRVMTLVSSVCDVEMIYHVCTASKKIIIALEERGERKHNRKR